MRNSKYTRGFRDSSMQFLLNSNEEIKTIAKDLGVNSKTLYNWVYNYKCDNNLQTYDRNNSSKSIIKESMDGENRHLLINKILIFGKVEKTIKKELYYKE